MSLRPYQRAAVKTARDYFAHGPRCSIVLPCGTGKTRIAAELANAKDLPTVVVLVPRIALLTQTITAITQALTEPRAVLAITGATLTNDDDDDLDPQALTVPNTTDADVLADFVSTTKHLLVVGTYTSAPVIAEASQNLGHTWDLMVLDEAHRTAGYADKHWSIALNNELIPAARRLSLTATPRQITANPKDLNDNGEPKKVASMHNPALYGPLHQPLTLRSAITDSWLSDYRVAVVAVTEQEVQAALGTDVVTPDGEVVDMTLAATQIALLRYAAKNPGLNSVLVFHNRIDDSRRWVQQFDAVSRLISEADKPSGELCATHLDGTMNATQRAAALETLSTPQPTDLHAVSNCKVLAEGVDVPALDAVVFAGPRSSAPDIVQIVGRALRLHPTHTNRKALVIVPVIISDDDSRDVEDVSLTTGYRTVWQVLTAMAHEDQALYRSLVSRRGDLTDEDNEDNNEDMVDFDFGNLPPHLAHAFHLHVINATTSTRAALAARIRSHLLRGGDTHPRTGYCLKDGYPLGQRMHAVRRCHHNGDLPHHLVRLFEDIPGWTWEVQKKRTTRTIDEWLDLVEKHLALTGGNRIMPFETTPTDDGLTIPTGKWVQRAKRLTMSTEQRERFDKLLPPQ